MEYSRAQLDALIRNTAGHAAVYQVMDGLFHPVCRTESVPAFFGLTDEESLSRSDRDAARAVHAADLPALRRQLDEVLSGGGDREAVFRTRRGEDGFAWTHAFFKLLGTLEGRPVLIASFTDVSSSAAALEEQLRQEKEKYRAAIEGANLRVYEYDILSRTILLPEHARRLFGASSSVLTGVPDSILPYFHQEDHDRVRRFFARVEHGEKRVTDEFLMKAVDGRAAYLRYTFTVVFDDAGRPVKSYALSEDITALKRNQATFNETLESLLSANPSALCSFRTNLSQNLCSEGHGVSVYIQKLLGAETADALFQNILSIIPDREQRVRASGFFSRQALLDAFAGGSKGLQLDYQRAGETGKLLWVRTFVNMLKNPETQDVIAVFYSLDITAEKRQREIFDIITKQEYDYVALLHAEQNKIEFLNLSPKLLSKYHKAFGQSGALFDFDMTRLFAADSWVDGADRDSYLRASSAEAVREGLDRSGHYELSVRGHYTGRPDETMCRKIQHYYLDESREIILIIQSDVTETYLQQERETARAKSEKEQLADILNKLSTGICVLSMPDPEHVRTTFCNQQIYQLLDMKPNASTPEELDPDEDPLLLRYFRDEFSGIHPDDLPRTRQAFREGYGKSAFTVSNVRYLGGKGAYKNITIDLVLRESRPDGRIFYASYRDVSQEVALRRELELRQQKRMENTLVDTIGRLPACSVLYRETETGPSEAERYSDEFCRLKECSQEEVRRLSGGDAFAPVHPDDRKALKEAVLASKNDDQMHTAVYRIITGRSGYKWVSVNYTHFTFAGQRYLYAVYTDIDELKKQEQQLEEQYNSAQAFLDSISGSYLTTQRVNLTKNLVESSSGTSPLPRASALPEYDAAAEALFSAVPSPQERAECREFFSRRHLLRVYESGAKNLSRDYRYLTPEGSLRWARGSITLTRRPGSGDVISFVAVNDISREKLIGLIMDRVISTQFDHVSCIDARTGKIEFFFAGNGDVNGQEIRSGSSYDAVISALCDTAVIPSERESFSSFMRLDSITARLDSEQRCIHSFTVGENGGLRAKQVEFFYVDRENKLIALLRTDYTEAQHRQLEQEERLRSALAAAKRANEAKSDFLSRMSHDIRTPLNGIIGMTYIAQEQPNPERTADCLSKIDTSSKFLLSLINDILDLTKAESDKIELHPEPYPPEEFYGYLDAVFQPQCIGKRQTLIVDKHPPAGFYPLFDKLRINQVLFNLLSNAVKYTPEGGTITYRDRFSPPDAAGRTTVRFEVLDTGIGMSEEFRKHLFEPFTQEGRSDTSESRGSGLGLAIAKKLVDLMGGTISLDSKSGKGSDFTVTITTGCVPSSDEVADAGKANAAKSPKSLAGRHVLLCEDHPLNQEIAKALLAERRMIVTVAEDGRIGAELFRQSPIRCFDVILMDIRMPVMNGYEAARAIRSMDRPDAGTVPIIAMTADAFEDDVQKCLDAGMNGHIPKPIDPERMFDMILSVL